MKIEIELKDELASEIEDYCLLNGLQANEFWGKAAVKAMNEDDEETRVFKSGLKPGEVRFID